jgi:hypothetical protein
VVEQLLRTTGVQRIFLLVRGKRDTRGEERIARLLHSGLFHLVRDDPKLLSKVGDNQRCIPAGRTASTTSIHGALNLPEVSE